jgi:hypothetical protein
MESKLTSKNQSVSSEVAELGARSWPKRVGRIALCAALAISAASCSIRGGDIWIGNYEQRVGEFTPYSGGLLIVLFRGDQGDLGVSQILLDYYKNLRRTQSIETAARNTLRFLRGYCDEGDGIYADRCKDATAGDEWEDFRQALVDIDSRPGACLAVTVRSGENWTYRNRSDENCTPNSSW